VQVASRAAGGGRAGVRWRQRVIKQLALALPACGSEESIARQRGSEGEERGVGAVPGVSRVGGRGVVRGAEEVGKNVLFDLSRTVDMLERAFALLWEEWLAREEDVGAGAKTRGAGHLVVRG
jgi:hypothetical protein